MLKDDLSENANSKETQVYMTGNTQSSGLVYFKDKAVESTPFYWLCFKPNSLIYPQAIPITI